MWQGITKTDFSLIHIFLETTKCVSVVRKQSKAIWSIIYRQTESVRGVYENTFFIAWYDCGTAQSVWVFSENTPKPSEASYLDKQNVWEGSTKTDFSSIFIRNIKFIEGTQVCECCPKTDPNNKRTLLARNRFIVVIWRLLPKVLCFTIRNDRGRQRLLQQ